MPFRYIPNALGKAMFNLKAAAYTGSDLTNVLDDPIGKDNASRWIPPQDPLRGGASEGEIVIVTSPGDPDPAHRHFLSIGTIQRI